MKKIYLVRHAKSDKNNIEIEDFDRPLNARGYYDAHIMGKVLKEKKIIPDLIISSPAIRALSTALIFCRIYKLKTSEIIMKEELYESSVEEYMNVIKQTDDRFKSIMLFGHNPTLTDLTTHLIKSFSENMPTSAIVGIEFSKEYKEWKSIDTANNKLILYDFPKNHLLKNFS